MRPERRTRMPGSTALIIATAPNTLGVELLAYVVQRRFLQDTFMAVAGIVDEDVDRTDRALCLGNGPRNGVKIRHNREGLHARDPAPSP